MRFPNFLRYKLRFTLLCLEVGLVFSFIFFHPLFENALLGCSFSLNMANQSTETSQNKDVSVINREYFEYLARQLHNTSFAGVDNYIQYVTAFLKLETLSDVNPLREDYGLVLNDVTSFIYPIEVRTYRNKPGLFVAVISTPHNFEKREVIRQTWLHLIQMQSQLSLFNLAGFGFVVGLTTDQQIQKQIEGESKTHGDILQIDMIDNYNNLPVKTVGLINWLNNHCSNVDFTLKVDDDVYVNVHNLANFLATLDPDENSIYGAEADGIPTRDNGRGKISFFNFLFYLFNFEGNLFQIFKKILTNVIQICE